MVSECQLFHLFLGHENVAFWYNSTRNMPAYILNLNTVKSVIKDMHVGNVLVCRGNRFCTAPNITHKSNFRTTKEVC